MKAEFLTGIERYRRKYLKTDQEQDTEQAPGEFTPPQEEPRGKEVMCPRNRRGIRKSDVGHGVTMIF